MLRILRSSPSFVAITILTLALGIGVITALFAVVNAVLLNPIVPDQDRVVRIWQLDAARDGVRASISYRQFEAWRDETRVFAGLAAIQYADASDSAISLDGRAVPVSVTPVSANFFEVANTRAPLLGRWLDARDEFPGAEMTAVVSERFWRRMANGDPGVIGRRFTFAGGGRSIVVAGIAPAEFEYPLDNDLWVPAARFFDGVGERFDNRNHGFHQFEVIGRLAAGRTVDEGRAELTVIDGRFVRQYPDNYRVMPIVVTPLLDTVVGNSRQVLWFLFGAGALVFVIGGVNVAALLLMRGVARTTEYAIRIALGASRAQLVRQSLIESALLALAGGAAGLAVARALLGLVQLVAPGDVPRIEAAAINGQVVAFLGAAMLVWVAALGTAPLWVNRKLHLTAASGAFDFGVRGARATAGLRIFTVIEVAAAVAVAVGAGLLARSFAHLQGIDRGFTTHNLAVMSLRLPEGRYPDAVRRRAFYEELLTRVTAIAGVSAASPVHFSPGTANVGLGATMIFEGQTPEEAEKNPWGSWEPILPSFFETMGIPIVAGRGFDTRDRADTAPVVIVSQSVADRYWPGENPVGKKVQFVARSKPATVVGVAADMRYRELTKNWMTVYFAAPQFFFFVPSTLVIRASVDPFTLMPAIRQTINTLDSQIAIERVSTMEELTGRELSRPKTAVTVTSVFALAAVLLSAIGVYGVMSYEVRRRRRELAIRSAVGASPTQIFHAVLARSFKLGALGAVIGLAAAGIAAQSMRALLYELDPGDPLTFTAGFVALLVVVLTASLLPARRAASADPVVVLRAE